MHLHTIPDLRPGTTLVFRPTRDGSVRVDLQRSAGYVFAADADVTGFVQDARVMLRVLSQLDMPRSWYRAWLGMVSLQDYDSGDWVLRMTHDDLSAACKVPRPHLSEPMAYYDEIGWIRRIKRGHYQLNPWLTHCGGSNLQAAAQEAWLRADSTEFVLPGSAHPALWRAERLAANPAPTRDGQVLSLPLILDPHTETAAQAAPEQAKAAETVDLAARGRRPSQAGAADRVPVTRQVRDAMDQLGVDAPTHRIQQWLVNRYQDAANPATLKSAISRERKRRAS